MMGERNRPSRKNKNYCQSQRMVMGESERTAEGKKGQSGKDWTKMTELNVLS